LAFGRFDPFSALGCVLRTASVSIGLGQHLAQLSLRLRRLPRKARFLPLGHGDYVGMPEGEVNATGAAKSGAADINYFEDNPRPLRSA